MSFRIVLMLPPNRVSAAITMMAIKLGKHVYCEKPTATTMKEAYALGRKLAGE